MATDARVRAVRLRWAWLGVLIYLLILAYLTIGLVRFYDLTWEDRVNGIPFLGIIADIRSGGREFFVQVLGNIVIFIPWGMLVLAVSPLPLEKPGPIRRPLLRATLGGMALSTCVELLQLASARRVADIDDVILNSLGAFLGAYLLTRWFGKTF